jgi:hypothetical protein
MCSKEVTFFTPAFKVSCFVGVNCLAWWDVEGTLGVLVYEAKRNSAQFVFLNISAYFRN